MTPFYPFSLFCSCLEKGSRKKKPMLTLCGDSTSGIAYSGSEKVWMYTNRVLRYGHGIE